jgi:hypothetical protein
MWLDTCDTLSTLGLEFEQSSWCSETSSDCYTRFSQKLGRQSAFNVSRLLSFTDTADNRGIFCDVDLDLNNHTDFNTTLSRNMVTG